MHENATDFRDRVVRETAAAIMSAHGNASIAQIARVSGLSESSVEQALLRHATRTNRSVKLSVETFGDYHDV